MFPLKENIFKIFGDCHARMLIGAHPHVSVFYFKGCAAIFRAASLATPLVMVKIVAKIAATIVVESSIGFYFSKGLQ